MNNNDKWYTTNYVMHTDKEIEKEPVSRKEDVRTSLLVDCKSQHYSVYMKTKTVLETRTNSHTASTGYHVNSRLIYVPDGYTIEDIEKGKSISAERNDGSMSFAGIIMMKDGLLAFSDSKGTRMDKYGNRKEDTGRHVQKVFRYHGTLIVTHGINEIRMKRNDDIISLEDYINDGIRQKKGIMTMLDEIGQSSSVQDDGYAYHFIIGGIMLDAYCIEDIVVEKREDGNPVAIMGKLYQSKTDDRKYAYVSDTGTYPYTKDFFNVFLNGIMNRDISVTKASEELSSWMEEEINEIDRAAFYNIAGMPLQKEILQ